jgi:hypothetical protein
MSEITSEDKRAIMERYAQDVYQIRLTIASELYANGIARSAENCLSMADSFVLALIKNPPIY